MSKVYDGIMGLVVGDALGVPYEFKERDSFKCDDMVGYGTYNQPKGTWSDDSSMTLATLESIGRLGYIEPSNIMHNFYDWLYNGEFTPDGEVFDVGKTTEVAISRFRRCVPLNECGLRTVNNNGNGALMRILPFAFIKCDNQDVIDVASLTHAHFISLEGCLIYIDIAKNLLAGIPLDVAVANTPIRLYEYDRLVKLEHLSREEIKSTGYVVDTLEAALWCLLHTNNYKDAVLTAVNLGGDTDTIAAVAGGLAGIIYGCGGKNGIPLEWIEQIPRLKWIKGLCYEFENKVQDKFKISSR